MLALALPVLAEEALNLLVGLSDRFLVGWYLPGKDAQAAMGLVAYLLWLIPAFYSCISIGATAIVARHVGANEWDLARKATLQALGAGAALTVVVMLAVALGGRAFVVAMGLEAGARDLAVEFLWYIVPVIPFIMLEQVGSACLRGAGDTFTGMLARVALNAVNVVVAVALVTGGGERSSWGWSGIAIGSACGHAVGGVFILLWLLRRTRPLHLHGQRWSPDWELVRRMLRIGLPGGGDVLAIVFCHLAYLRIIASLGTLALAAHGLGLQIEALSFLSGASFQVAAATMAGQALGANDPRRAWNSVLAACGGALVLMSSAALLFFFQGQRLAQLFTGGTLDETSELAGRLLQVVAIGAVPLAVLIVVSGALRGVGDTTWNLAITLIGLVGVRLPLAAWLAWDYIPLGGDWVSPGLGWGVLGAWWGMVADVGFRSVLVGWRFFHGGWLKLKV